MPSGQARARAMARRRRKQRQRRMILGSLLLVILLIAGGTSFGVVHYRNLKEKQAFASAGIEAMEQGDYEAAIVSFDQALLKADGKIGAFEKDVLLYRAEAEYKQEDYPAAKNTYELLLKEDKDNAEYKKGMVLCLVEAGDYGAALDLEVLQGIVYNRMAKEQIEAGQYDRALEYIEQGKTFAEESAGRELAFNEAAAWEYKHDYAKALGLFEAYVQKYGADETAEREIAFLKTRQGSH